MKKPEDGDVVDSVEEFIRSPSMSKLEEERRVDNKTLTLSFFGGKHTVIPIEI